MKSDESRQLESYKQKIIAKDPKWRKSAEMVIKALFLTFCTRASLYQGNKDLEYWLRNIPLAIEEAMLQDHNAFKDLITDFIKRDRQYEAIKDKASLNLSVLAIANKDNQEWQFVYEFNMVQHNYKF